jgi:hypothetical protein
MTVETELWTPLKSPKVGTAAWQSQLLERDTTTGAGPCFPDLRRRTPPDKRKSPPTRAELERARASPPRSVSVLLAIMTSELTSSRLNRSAATACTHPGIARCVAYTDGWRPLALPPDSHPGIELVPRDEYMPKSAQLDGPGSAACCDNSNDLLTREDAGYVQMRELCNDTHRKSTLDAQYRFLPALAHAAAYVRSDPRVKFLVLVDDDSLVNAPALRKTLSRVDHTKAVRLGDFGQFTHIRSYGAAALHLRPPPYVLTRRLPAVAAPSRANLSWNPPVGCGGSGSVFSRTAVARMDFHRCAVKHAAKCTQSDWVRGAQPCARRLAVTRHLSMPACVRAGYRWLRRRLRHPAAARLLVWPVRSHVRRAHSGLAAAHHGAGRARQVRLRAADACVWSGPALELQAPSQSARVGGEFGHRPR